MKSPNVSNYLENSTFAHPDKLALIFEDGQSEPTKWTFREFNQMANRIANGIIDMGVREGDRVTLFLPTCPEFFPWFYGVMKIGAIVNPLNPMLKENELDYIVGNCQPKIIVTAKEVLEMPLKVFSKPDNKVQAMIVVNGDEGNNIINYENWIKKYPDSFDSVPVDSNDVACLLYTSGTTGRPKGVMLTHQNLWTNARHNADWAKTTYRDIGCSSLPQFHIYCISHVMGELWIEPVKSFQTASSIF